MGAPGQITISVSHSYRAAPEKVFDAFLDPAQARKFMFVTDTGSIVRCDIEPKVGGKFVITDRRDGEDVAHEGEFFKIDRPRALGFSVRVPKYSEDVGQVLVELQPTTSGCKATLTETVSDAWEPHRKDIEAGWSGILGRLERAL